MGSFPFFVALVGSKLTPLRFLFGEEFNFTEPNNAGPLSPWSGCWGSLSLSGFSGLSIA